MTQPSNFAAVGTADGAASLTRGIAADRIKDTLLALLNSNYGATRPSYAEAGSIWCDSDTDIWYLYDGTTDIPLNEVGTWTPEVADASTGGTTATIGSVDARYFRIAHSCTIIGRVQNIDWSACTGTNTLYIRSLPLTAGAAPNAMGTIVTNLVTHTSVVELGLQVQNAANYARIFETVSGGGFSYMQVDALEASPYGADLFFTATYEV